jgi:hypothetical protein
MKYDHHKPRWTKPKMPTIEKALCKPLLVDFVVQEENNDKE